MRTTKKPRSGERGSVSVDLCSLFDPAGQQVTLFLGHLGDVAQWHDLAGDGLRMNLGSHLLDLLGRIEHHAGWCRAEQRAGGLCGMAHGATFFNDTADLVERAVACRAAVLLADARLLGGSRRQVLRSRLTVWREYEGQANHADGGGGQGPGEAVAVVAGVEVVAGQYRQRA